MKKYIPILFTFFGFLLLFSLGTWQLVRLQEKNEAISKIDARLSEAPITLAEFKDAESDEFRLITLSGSYDYKHEFVVLGRQLNGKPGQHIITPMLTEGKTILVNRGWTKYDEEYNRPEGLLTITGIIRKQPKPNALNKLVLQDNNPKENIWFWVDVKTMSQKAMIDDTGFYVEVVDNNRDYNGRVTDIAAAENLKEQSGVNSYPYALPKEIKLYNEHKNYAITWYALSFALLIMYYFRFHRRK